MKSFPRFFTKQFIAFAAIAFLIIIVDLVLYTFFALHEMNENYTENTPSLVVRQVDNALVYGETGYEMGEEGAAALDENHAWAILIAANGEVTWQYAAPEKVLKSYTVGDTALLGHYGYLEEYPAFIWSRDDGLLVLGFPSEDYSVFSATTVPRESVTNVSSYVGIVLLVELLIFFAAYMLSKRRTVKNISPITDALEELSQGKTVSLELRGDLSDISEQLNKTSSIIKKKDTARENWIRGISHDIRTPLSVITGYSDSIANDPKLPEKTRKDAALVRAQGMKIKDLILDLNAASQLEYDMQPLAINPIGMAKVLREIITEYLNDGLLAKYLIELDIMPGANDLAVMGDERLFRRAVQNLIQNAIDHNPEGCSIKVSLFCRRDGMVEYDCLSVVDRGRGMSALKLAEVQNRLFNARIYAEESTQIRGDDSGFDTFHGLGLVLVEKIVRAHNGFMRITSSEGQGFSAEITLPMYHASTFQGQ